MKAEMFTIEGKKAGAVELPQQCMEEYRPDLIRRAFLAYQSHNRQPYGAYPKAGQRSSAKISRRRRQYKGAYGHGISRVPRKSLWKRGRQFGWVGAFAPNTVKGRRAHPPKAQKIFAQKMNVKERRKAIRSAIAATFNLEAVRLRGHRVEVLPSIIEAKAEALNKTKEVENLLFNLKLQQEMERTDIRKVRAGKGKMRNRKYKKKKGPLFVVSQSCPLQKAATNLPGVDACVVDHLNINLLAPGGHPGRLTLFTENALKRLSDEQLFTNVTAPKEASPKSAASPVQEKAAPKKPQPTSKSAAKQRPRPKPKKQ